MNATHLVHETASIAHAGPQSPHDYGTGFLTTYSSEAWDLMAEVIQYADRY